MESLDERVGRLEYYQRVLMKVLDEGDFPLYRLFIEGDLHEEEIKDFFTFCECMQKKYKEQKEQGFVNFFPLLIQFAGMLTTKLHPDATMKALLKQGMYEELMKELLYLRYAFNRL